MDRREFFRFLGRLSSAVVAAKLSPEKTVSAFVVTGGRASFSDLCITPDWFARNPGSCNWTFAAPPSES